MKITGQSGANEYTSVGTSFTMAKRTEINYTLSVQCSTGSLRGYGAIFSGTRKVAYLEQVSDSSISGSFFAEAGETITVQAHKDSSVSSTTYVTATISF